MHTSFVAAALCSVVLFPHNLSAQSETACPMTGDDSNCVRVVACIGDQVSGLTVAHLAGVRGPLAEQHQRA